MEETGAALSHVKPIGMYHCVSQEAQPRLPHFPHPIHVREVRSLKCGLSSTIRQQICFPLTTRISRLSMNWPLSAENIGHNVLVECLSPPPNLAHPITRPCPASGIRPSRNRIRGSGTARTLSDMHFFGYYLTIPVRLDIPNRPEFKVILKATNASEPTETYRRCWNSRGTRRRCPSG